MSSRKIGALWIKESKGIKYLSGVLNDLRGDIPIAVFKNDRKEKENQPDYNIVVLEQQEARKTPEIKSVDINELPEIEPQPEDLPF